MLLPHLYRHVSLLVGNDAKENAHDAHQENDNCCGRGCVICCGCVQGSSCEHGERGSVRARRENAHARRESARACRVSGESGHACRENAHVLVSVHARRESDRVSRESGQVRRVSGCAQARSGGGLVQGCHRVSGCVWGSCDVQQHMHTGAGGVELLCVVIWQEFEWGLAGRWAAACSAMHCCTACCIAHVCCLLACVLPACLCAVCFACVLVRALLLM